MLASAGICWLLGVCAIGGDLYSVDVHVLGSLLMRAMGNLCDDGSVFAKRVIRYPAR